MLSFWICQQENSDIMRIVSVKILVTYPLFLLVKKVILTDIQNTFIQMLCPLTMNKILK